MLKLATLRHALGKAYLRLPPTRRVVDAAVERAVTHNNRRWRAKIAATKAEWRRAQSVDVRRLTSEVDRLRKQEQQSSERHRAAWENSKDFGYAYRRLLAAARQVRPNELGNATVRAPDSERSQADVYEVKHLAADAEFVRALRRGHGLDEVVSAYVRSRSREPYVRHARAMVHSLLAVPSTEVVGSLGAAIQAIARDLPSLAWTRFTVVPRDMWRRNAAGEFFEAAFHADEETAIREARALIADRAAEVSASAWIRVVSLTLSASHLDLARQMFNICDEFAAQDEPGWSAHMDELEWLRPWFAAEDRTGTAVSPTSIAFGVLDYKSTDRRYSSANLGDYVQSVAALGHLVRHTGVVFTGEDGLEGFAADLQKRVRPEHARPTPGEVTLIRVNRDASSLGEIPNGTWMFAFGWYGHRLAGVRHGFPFHPNIRPIFISFHVNRRRLLTPEAIEYLKKHAPIGCRDWSTVDLLRSAGVPAFFSGCITTTIATVIPDRKDADRSVRRPVAYTDVYAEGVQSVIKQETEEVRDRSMVSNMAAAIDMVESYRDDYSGLVTRRLHSYLPARAIGVPVEFRPKRRADVRFNGLIDLSNAEFDTMGDRIRSLLAPVIAAILNGDSEESVYAVWARACEPELARADARATGLPALPPPSVDVDSECARICRARVVVPRQVSTAGGPEVNVALALDGNLKEQVRVVIEAMVAASTRSLHLWMLTRDHGPDDHEILARLFPSVAFTWLPFDGVVYGDIVSMLPHITVSTMDRLLLPELLPELDRIVYHDIDALPLADIGELYDWDLGGNPLAARDAESPAARSGFTNVYTPANQLGDDAEAAFDLIQRVHARHAFDFVGFNAGIMVLDLARMRSDGFCREFLTYVERYGMNDQQVLNCYAGPNRAALPAEWNAWPIQEVVANPKIIHWAGGQKPWDVDYVLFRNAWQDVAARVESRLADIRSTGQAARTTS